MKKRLPPRDDARYMRDSRRRKRKAGLCWECSEPAALLSIRCAACGDRHRLKSLAARHP
jgi:hypothetical protein